jgi:hypothetical protein
MSLMQKYFYFFAQTVLYFVLHSCAEKDKTTTTSDAPKKLSLEQRLNKQEGFTKDSEGNWKANSKKRSSFEKIGKNSLNNKIYESKEYKSPEYKKKSWLSKSEIEKKDYNENIDANRFLTKSSYSNKTAREKYFTTQESNRSFKTNRLDKTSALENSKNEIKRTADAETNFRRKVEVDPVIIDWRQQRAIDMKSTRSILGR